MQFSDDLVEATPTNVEDRLFRRVDHFGMPMELQLGSAEQKAALRRQKSSGKVSWKFLKPRPVEAAMRFCQQVQACGVLLAGSKTHSSNLQHCTCQAGGVSNLPAALRLAITSSSLGML